MAVLTFFVAAQTMGNICQPYRSTERRNYDVRFEPVEAGSKFYVSVKLHHTLSGSGFSGLCRLRQREYDAEQELKTAVDNDNQALIFLQTILPTTVHRWLQNRPLPYRNFTLIVVSDQTGSTGFQVLE